MQLRFCRTTTQEELEQILELQQKNLFQIVPKKIKKKEGFVTAEHTFDLLNRMNEVCPHFIAKDGAAVIGYALCMHPKFADEIEVLRPMFDQIASTLPDATSFMTMGQICIASQYRQKGVFRKLYRSMEDALRSKFDFIFTEVDATNTRSLQAHYAIGFKILKSYRSGIHDWKLLQLQLK